MPWILDTAFLFFLAELDTLQGELRVHFADLARHSDHSDRLVNEPDLIRTAVEELLRWGKDVSGPNLTRAAA